MLTSESKVFIVYNRSLATRRDLRIEQMHLVFSYKLSTEPSHANDKTQRKENRTFADLCTLGILPQPPFA
jgi:hypothetical protein